MNYTPIRCKDIKEREKILRETCTEALGELVIGTLIDKGFLTAPASTRYHGNYEGGLFDHSVNVARVLSDLTYNNCIVWKQDSAQRAPWVIGMLHDLCKIDQYVQDIDGYSYSHEPIVTGHGTKSVIYAQAMGARLSEEERACIIYHMGAFTDESEWSNYTHAIHKYPNVLWVHTADMIVTHIMEV